ncbi:hypothetical protein [Melissospora conviva]|uniref:hypothetical protein n=1 Tax=Melissospora conviva TaxID=3388432 RepID=UPI003C24C940
MRRRRPVAALGIAVLLSAADPWSPIDRFTFAVMVLAHLADRQATPPPTLDPARRPTGQAPAADQRRAQLWWWTAIVVSGTVASIALSTER